MKEDLGDKPEEQNLERRVERAAGSVKAVGALMRKIGGHPEKGIWMEDGLGLVCKKGIIFALAIQRNAKK